MQIHETGEVREHVRLPDPDEAGAFEVDMPQPVHAGAEGGGDPGGPVPVSNEIADDSNWGRERAGVNG